MKVESFMIHLRILRRHLALVPADALAEADEWHCCWQCWQRGDKCPSSGVKPRYRPSAMPIKSSTALAAWFMDSAWIQHGFVLVPVRDCPSLESSLHCLGPEKTARSNRAMELFGLSGLERPLDLQSTAERGNERGPKHQSLARKRTSG